MPNAPRWRNFVIQQLMWVSISNTRIREWCVNLGCIFFAIAYPSAHESTEISPEITNLLQTWRTSARQVNTNFHPSNWHWIFRDNYTTQYPMLYMYWKAYRSKKNENRQNYSFSSTRNSVSKLCRADLQYLGLKTPLKTVNFQLFCWILLFQYSKKFYLPGGCLVCLVDIRNCKVKPSIRVQFFASPVVNLLSLFNY